METHQGPPTIGARIGTSSVALADSARKLLSYCGACGDVMT